MCAGRVPPRVASAHAHTNGGELSKGLGVGRFGTSPKNGRSRPTSLRDGASGHGFGRKWAPSAWRAETDLHGPEDPRSLESRMPLPESGEHAGFSQRRWICLFSQQRPSPTSLSKRASLRQVFLFAIARKTQISDSLAREPPEPCAMGKRAMTASLRCNACCASFASNAGNGRSRRVPNASVRHKTWPDGQTWPQH